MALEKVVENVYYVNFQQRPNFLELKDFHYENEPLPHQPIFLRAIRTGVECTAKLVRYVTRL